MNLSDDHAGLMILNERPGVAPGVALVDLLDIVADVVLEISPEGNRPDAWSVEGVARDLAARWRMDLRPVALATPNGPEPTQSLATGEILAPELCGSLGVAAIRNVQVTSSPPEIRRRIEMAGMRAVNNVVDASNYVMLELGQPTHPYDATRVAGRHIGVRQARTGERLVTLDEVDRELGVPGRGLGDTGVDCVIVDGDDAVIGLAGIMGGQTSEISTSTVDVIVEAAFFDPMTIARTVKRLGLRSEASKRFERGVDPQLAPRAMARFVEILRLSSPELIWLSEPVIVRGTLPEPPVLEINESHIEGLLGTHIPVADSAALLRGLGFAVTIAGDSMTVTAPSSRLDIRTERRGRADVIEEIARLYGYRRLERRTPTWPEPGGLSSRQQTRRRLRDAAVGLGFLEAWTPSLLSDDEFERGDAGVMKVRVSNPLAAEESVLRASMLVGLSRAWSRNVERGEGEVALFEIGTVVVHPEEAEFPRSSRGGLTGDEKIALPSEHERMLMLLGRSDDDATTAVATWRVIFERLELDDVVIRSTSARRGWHPTRCGALVDRRSGAELGRIGELDPAVVADLAPTQRDARRVGLIEIDLDAIADATRATRRSSLVVVPSRYPSATIDLAFVTPHAVNAADLAHELRSADDLVESVRLFDVFSDKALGEQVRSLAFTIRLTAEDRTLSESDISATRLRLIDVGASLGARLR